VSRRRSGRAAGELAAEFGGPSQMIGSRKKCFYATCPMLHSRHCIAFPYLLAFLNCFSNTSHFLDDMPPTHISGTSRALYRVFVAPTLRAPTSIPLLWAPAFAHAPSLPSQSTRITSRTTIRTKTYQKDTARHALTDHYVLDNAIQSNRINFVDENGKFEASIPLADALSRVNRTTHHLVQLTSGKVDEYGNQDPDDLPTCRIVTKIALRQQHQKKLELERRQAKGLGAGPPPKNLEFNWAIAGGDLKHRLGKLKEFLSEGRKVEIMLGPKKKGRKATEEEAESVIRAIRETVSDCKGATETHSEGGLGEVMTITYQGWKKKEKEKEKEKNKRREANAMADDNAKEP
jgi:translation initiation factor IF-3